MKTKSVKRTALSRDTYGIHGMREVDRSGIEGMDLITGPYHAAHIMREDRESDKEQGRRARDKSVFVIDIRSERRREGDPINKFTFPLASAGIVTPRDSNVTIRCCGAHVSLANEQPDSFDKRFRLYIENLPVYRGGAFIAQNTDTRLAVAYGDYRLERVNAALDRASQPIIQLVPGAPLPDLDVALVDEEGDPFLPGKEWNILLLIEADQAIYTNIH